MNIRLVKNGGDLNTPADCFDLPACFLFSEDPFERDIDVTKKAFQHGGIKQGDGTAFPKEIIATGFYETNAVKTVSKWTSELMSFAMYSEPMRLYVVGNSLDGDWFWGDCYLSSRPKRPQIYSRIDELDIVFKITNPFWQSETLTSQTFSNVTDQSNIQITVTGDFDVSPVIEITALGNNGSFSIINTSNNYLSLDVNDPTFLTGNKIIIDSLRSTITKNNISIMDKLASVFLELKKGVNNLKYVGQSSVDIKISYRNLRS